MADMFDEMFKDAMRPFTPHLTPAEMMRMGVFGGSYFANAREEDFEGMAPETEELARKQVGKYRVSVNCFLAKSGDSRDAWAAQGWLKPEDPLGWFHWYCRYHNGRRHMRDHWQINRWHNFGDRWIRYARNRIAETGGCTATVKQGLLHWSYLPAKVIYK
jgi:hypothetical protein